MHDGKHDHSHGGGKGSAHSHGLEDSKPGDASAMDKPRLKAVLTYMKDHNREHARELHGLIGAIERPNDDRITSLIEGGVKNIEAAADQIEHAIKLLEER
ncbi:MAG: hypothetical protein LBS67_06520 [Clostridiales Family XIII bacterium]|jgi:hypothetical protein|nr:hypothetical protein [Clostridiales Family XIII bacterium]